MFPEARGVEFLIIAALALIVVGPKELPGLLRKLGQFVGKMRNIANDFRTSFDEMARQSELDDLRKQVDEMRAQTAAAMPGDPLVADPVAFDPEMEQFRRDYEAQMASTPSYGEPVHEPVVAKPKPKRAPRKKPAAAADIVEPVKKKPAAKSKRAASKDIVQ